MPVVEWGWGYKQNRDQAVLKKNILSKNYTYTFHINLKTLKPLLIWIVLRHKIINILVWILGLETSSGKKGWAQKERSELDWSSCVENGCNHTYSKTSTIQTAQNACALALGVLASTSAAATVHNNRTVWMLHSLYASVVCALIANADQSEY